MAVADRGEVRAAGGVVTRRGRGGGLEVLLVHRPAYDDWTFPKGKADQGENDEDCAVREVEEETGLVCAIDGPVGETSYLDPRGRAKMVRYFAMHPVGGQISLLHEVDDARWVPLEDAVRLLTYERDRELLQAAPNAS